MINFDAFFKKFKKKGFFENLRKIFKVKFLNYTNKNNNKRGKIKWQRKKRKGKAMFKP